MKVLLQRVNHASVVVEQKTIGQIERGLLLLVGFGKDDIEDNLSKMAEKVLNLRVFTNTENKFDHSVLDIKGDVLLVPQFTLYGETKKGRRPDFFNSLEPKLATEYFDKFVNVVKTFDLNKVATGEFGVYMKVSLENDGPVTLLLEV